MAKPQKHILVCMNSRPEGHPRGSCGTAGATAVMDKMRTVFEEKALYEKAFLTSTGCMGPCQMGPLVVVYPDGVWYQKVTPSDVDEIIEKHIIGGEVVERLLLPDETWG